MSVFDESLAHCICQRWSSTASVTVVGQRRPPFVLLEGLGLTSALDGCDCLCAVDGRLSAPRLLTRGSVRGVLPRSTARDLRLAYPVDPSCSGGGCDEVIRSCSRFSSQTPLSSFFLRRRGQSHRTCGAANTRVHLKDARCGVVDGGGRGGQFSFYLIWLVHGGFWVKK